VSDNKTARIYLDTNRIISPVSPLLFSGFAEHMGRCIYGGIYDPGSPLADENGLRRDVKAALRELNFRSIRYPGGNFLSGYPYFTDSGTKLLYARVGYGFPILKRISSRFINFNFSKLYAELFAEAGVVGNFSRFEDIDFWSGERWRSLPNTDEFLTNVGGELRLQLFTFYRIPMFAYLQVAHPLNRERVASDPDDPLIDKWRYYFGFGL